MVNGDFVKELQELALGTRLKRLSDSLMNDVGRIYKEQHLDFEPKWFTMLFLLAKEKSLSILEIAERLKLSHPAVVQFANQMEKQKLVLAKKDKLDARKRIITLSTKGKETFENLQPILTQVEKSTRQIIKDSGMDVLLAIEKLEILLTKKSMYERVNEGLKQNKNSEITIVPYETAYSSSFKKLNEEWLNEYFELEAEDHKILGNPEKYIIEKGGTLFFAVTQNKIVGTVAVSNHGRGIFELNKMAVTKKFRNQSIGSMLMEKAIAFSKMKKAKQLYLETNLKLRSAIHVYEKFGFLKDAPLPKSKYKRSNLKMILTLKPTS
jgi:DNA-binding MarR family transcriptional regulator/ribosomal protein S18 acetylase RimI-like enzyme